MKGRVAALVRLRWLFVVGGLVLLCGGAAVALYEASRPDDAPILRFPTALSVSDAGEIFVFCEWGRVRVFAPDGRQPRSWRVDTASGMAVLAFEEPEALLVATARNDGSSRSEAHRSRRFGRRHLEAPRAGPPRASFARPGAGRQPADSASRVTWWSTIRHWLPSRR